MSKLYQQLLITVQIQSVSWGAKAFRGCHKNLCRCMLITQESIIHFYNLSQKYFILKGIYVRKPPNVPENLDICIGSKSVTFFQKKNRRNRVGCLL